MIEIRNMELNLIVQFHFSEWKKLTMLNIVNALHACKLYEYRYIYNSVSYISPPTPQMWHYHKFTEVPGVWRTNDGRSFECWGGNISVDSYGIGCNNGTGNGVMVLPRAMNGTRPDTMSGTGSVCQPQPNYWNEDCPLASISFRCYSKWNVPGTIKGF